MQRGSASQGGRHHGETYTGKSGKVSDKVEPTSRTGWGAWLILRSPLRLPPPPTARYAQHVPVNWIVRLDALKVAVVVKGMRSGTDLITIGKTSTDYRVEVEVAGFTSMVHCEDFQVPIGSHDYGSPQRSQSLTETTSLGFAVQFEIPQTGVPI